jgi:histidinol-phosphate aminotransferase
VKQHANLIVLRTLSKWAGLAGLRIGYMVANPSLIDVVLRVKQPYNVNVAAEIGTLASLDDLGYLKERVAAIIHERDRMASMLSEVPGLTVTPSQANFVLCHLEGIAARDVHQGLLERGILVRYFDTPLLQNHIRISAGRPDQTDALIRALREILAPADGHKGSRAYGQSAREA